MTPLPNPVDESRRSPLRWLADPFAATGRRAINWVNNLGASTIFLFLGFLRIFRQRK